MLTYAICYMDCIRYRAAGGEPVRPMRGDEDEEEDEDEDEDEDEEDIETVEGVPEHIGSGMFEMGVMERKTLVSKAHALLLRSYSVRIYKYSL